MAGFRAGEGDGMAAKSKVKALLEAMGGEWKSCDCCGKLFDVRTPKSGT